MNIIPLEFREAHDALRRFVNEAPVALAMFDRSLSLIGASRAWGALVDTVPSTRGPTLDELFPQNAGTMHDAAQRGLRGETLQGDVTWPGPEGTAPRPLRWRIWPWHDTAGTIGGVVLYATEMANDAQTAAIFRLLSFDDTGHDLSAYLRRCVAGLSRILGVDWVHLAVPCADASGMMQTLAVCRNGQIEPDFRYALAGTPCDAVTRDASCFFPAGVHRLFPEDRALADLQIEAYAGVQLQDRNGALLGVMAAMHGRPLADDSLVEAGLLLASIGIGAALDRDRAETVVRDREQLTCSVLDAMDALIVVLDTEGRIVFANQAWRAAGDNAAILPGMGTVGDDYRDVCARAASACPEAARVGNLLRDTMAGGEGSEGFEFVCASAGVSRWFRCSIRRFETSGTMHVLVKFQETTEARLAQQRNNQMHRQFSHLFDCAPDAMFMVDHHGRIRLANDRALAMFGYDSHELEGQPVEILINAKGRSRHVELRESFTRSQRQTAMGDRRSTLRGRHRDGSEFPVEISLSRYSGPGDEYMIAALRDVSVREQAQADRLARQVAEEANNAKSTFLATMSHEIRTPLSAVLGLAEVLSESTLSYDQSQLLDTMRGSATHLLRLIDDVLDFSKIEAGSLEIERAPVDLASLIEHAARGLVPHAAERGVELRLFVAPEVPRRVLSDEVRLRQIIYNLLGNAIKFSIEGHGRRGCAALRAEYETGAMPVLRLEFTDNGIGMNAGELERVFLPFTQAEQSTTRKFGGTGLGLTICKRIVDKLGGEIAIDSVPGRGSTFVVRLPISPLADIDGGVAERGRALAGVLCVLRDSPCYASTDLRRLLEHRGATVIALHEATPTRMAGAGRTVMICGADDDMPSDLPAGLPRVTIGNDNGPRLSVMRRGQVFVQARALSADDLAAAVELAGNVAEATPPPKDVVARPAPPPGTEGTAPILVAEDDPTNRKVILRQLELLGLRADMARDGAEALEFWRSGDYALLLTDLHMPVMDGYALTRAIRADEAGRKGKRVPIVALTANALRDEVGRARSAGLDGFLTKPMSLVKLGEALAEWLPAASAPAQPPPAGTAPPPATGHEAINTAAHAMMIGTDEETITTFLEAYRESSVDLAARIAGAIARAETSEAAMMLHRLKSSSRWIGAETLGDCCERLEGLALQGQHRALADGLADFGQLHAAVLDALAGLGVPAVSPPRDDGSVPAA